MKKDLGLGTVGLTQCREFPFDFTYPVGIDRVYLHFKARSVLHEVLQPVDGIAGATLPNSFTRQDRWYADAPVGNVLMASIDGHPMTEARLSNRQSRNAYTQTGISLPWIAPHPNPGAKVDDPELLQHAMLLVARCAPDPPGDASGFDEKKLQGANLDANLVPDTKDFDQWEFAFDVTDCLQGLSTHTLTFDPGNTIPPDPAVPYTNLYLIVADVWLAWNDSNGQDAKGWKKFGDGPAAGAPPSPALVERVYEPTLPVALAGFPFSASMTPDGAIDLVVAGRTFLVSSQFSRPLSGNFNPTLGPADSQNYLNQRNSFPKWEAQIWTKPHAFPASGSEWTSHGTGLGPPVPGPVHGTPPSQGPAPLATYRLGLRPPRRAVSRRYVDKAGLASRGRGLLTSLLPDAGAGATMVRVGTIWWSGSAAAAFAAGPMKAAR